MKKINPNLDDIFNDLQGRTEGCFDSSATNSTITLLNNNQGSRSGCLRSMRLFFSALVPLVWFRDGDLSAFKQASYVYAKLGLLLEVEQPKAFFYENDFIFALLSDHPFLCDWYTYHGVNSMQGATSLNSPSDHLFRHFQLKLALRKEWDLLGERAERFLNKVPTKMKMYEPDFRFYLSLAHQNPQGMHNAISELLIPKVAANRKKSEFLTGSDHFYHFIATYASMYTKIAWRLGYELDFNSPLIPQEWMPVKPLEHYIDPYKFLQEVNTNICLL